MKTITYHAKKLLVIVFCAALVTACSKKDDETNTPGTNNPGTNTPKPNWTDSLARKWVVKKATHNNQPDNSSEGLEFLFRKDGTYDFQNGDFAGTWRFQDSTYKKILLDENTASLKTVWTATVFTSKELKVDFKSAFTGGNSHWEFTAK